MAMRGKIDEPIECIDGVIVAYSPSPALSIVEVWACQAQESHTAVSVIPPPKLWTIPKPLWTTLQPNGACVAGSPGLVFWTGIRLLG
jgi:hypothetical protein